MRIQLTLCVIFVLGVSAHVKAQSLSPNSAEFEAMLCSDPVSIQGCKIYMSGFADTVQMAFALSTPRKIVCNDLPNLVYEFIREVRTNPEARKKDTQHVLYDLLTKNATCGDIKVHDLTAGDFIDTCLNGSIGFDVCSNYRTGATDALFLIDEGKAHALCGDRNRAFSVVPQMRLKLEADYKLRNEPASKVIAAVLLSLMPCH
jgi:hypothetical protein